MILCQSFEQVRSIQICSSVLMQKISGWAFFRNVSTKSRRRIKQFKKCEFEKYEKLGQISINISQFWSQDRFKWKFFSFFSSFPTFSHFSLNFFQFSRKWFLGKYAKFGVMNDYWTMCGLVLVKVLLPNFRHTVVIRAYLNRKIFQTFFSIWKQLDSIHCLVWRRCLYSSLV